MMQSWEMQHLDKLMMPLNEDDISHAAVFHNLHDMSRESLKCFHITILRNFNQLWWKSN